MIIFNANIPAGLKISPYSGKLEILLCHRLPTLVSFAELGASESAYRPSSHYTTAKLGKHYQPPAVDIMPTKTTVSRK